MYCSLQQTKVYLDIDAATDDALLTDLIRRAGALIDTHCRRTFEAPLATTRYFDPTDARIVRGARLYLDKDLCQIVTITNGDDEEVVAADYVTEPRNETPYYAITLRSQSGLTWTYDDDSENAISINGFWAYSVAPPDDIVQACVRASAWLYKQRDGAFGQTARPEIGIIETPLALPPDVRELLKPYRRARVHAI